MMSYSSPEWLREAFCRSLQPKGQEFMRNMDNIHLWGCRFPEQEEDYIPIEAAYDHAFEKSKVTETVLILPLAFFFFYISDFGPVFELMYNLFFSQKKRQNVGKAWKPITVIWESDWERNSQHVHSVHFLYVTRGSMGEAGKITNLSSVTEKNPWVFFKSD